ncbi:MAG: DNA-3-methyladenine glycosylase, partial [Fretibacterium sp.]|nr:DNA-3-methyladenine glycosylase [Fretibacterium sp.]
MTSLPRAFYMRDANLVAPELLGKLLVSQSGEGRASGLIVEVEAYVGPADKGAHSYQNRRTPRTEVQFGMGGYAYVYAIYGMYCCFNVVTNEPGKPEVVLVRALEPVEGIELMRARRRRDEPADLCSGPGKLCAALDISKKNYADDLCGERLYIEDRPGLPAGGIGVSP